MATSTAPGLGLLKGLGVVLKHMLRPASTQQYPHERPDLPPRTRGVIALMDENCTVCMLCARECPDWCIYIDSHKETVPPAKEGGRSRTRNVLDRFAIDFALCMYCGICVEVCPFDALFWSPEFEYTEYGIGGLLHEMDKLREWADTVPAPPPLEEGADQPSEVTDALAKAEKELEAARQAAIEEQTPAETKAAPAKKATAAGAVKQAEVHVDDAGEIDQETYDQLIAEGKSERVARSKAKAAYVRKRKKELQAEAASAGEAAAAPKPAEVHVEDAGEIDQETYDQLIAEGKSERVARSKAKAAYVRKRKRELQAEAGASPAGTGGDAQASADASAATDAAGSEEKPKKLADVHVEGAGEIDQETFDRLIAEGKSERIARAKAKAAWVKKKKQEQLDQEGGQ